MSESGTPTSAGRLADRDLIVAVGGGIAAYKTAYLVSRLVQAGARVHVAMTENATRFVGPLTFQALTHRPVLTSLWEATTPSGLEHLELTRLAKLFIVAPATANLLAKFACGLADNLVSTMALAAACPILLAPAMNHRMWNNPATQANVQTLKARGFHFIGPETGRLAEGENAIGRMAEPDDIFAAASRLCTVVKKKKGRDKRT